MSKPCAKCGKPISSLTRDTLCSKCKVLEIEAQEKAIAEPENQKSQYSTDSEATEDEVKELMDTVNGVINCPFETEGVALVLVNDGVIQCPSCSKEWHLVEMITSHHDRVLPKPTGPNIAKKFSKPLGMRKTKEDTEPHMEAVQAW